MPLFAGVDVGSSATKAVLVDEHLRVLGRGTGDSGADFAGAAESAFEQALGQAGVTRDIIGYVVSTGYGRGNVAFANAQRTEIHCHAKGAFHLFPRAITVVDIGGQDNKIIQVDRRGRRLDFAMNRKCAAGTGSFLEEIAHRLRIPLQDLSGMASRSTDVTVSIGSYCTVFAQTEILAKIRAGIKREDLARAAMVSVARRVLETLAVSNEVVATGGVVAHNPPMKEILSEILGVVVHVPPHAQHVGALGAAITAAGK